MQGVRQVLLAVGCTVVCAAGSVTFVRADVLNAPYLPGQLSHAGMAQGYGEAQEMGPYRGLSPLAMKEALSLSPEQVNRLRPLEVEYWKTMIEHDGDFQVAMLDLGMLMDVGQPDKDAITRQIDKMSRLQRQMMLNRVETLLQVKEILSPEQYALYRSQLRAHMETHMEGHGKGHVTKSDAPWR